MMSGIGSSRLRRVSRGYDDRRKPKKHLEISRLKRAYTHFDVIHYLSERIMQSVKEREHFRRARAAKRSM
jgi:hypothetical protein